MKKWLVLILVFCAIVASAQSKRDYVWLFGGSDWDAETEGIQCYHFDFKHEPFEVEPITYYAYPFDHNNASICDNEGNLLFYTNGCAVMDATHHVMPNGDSLNYGEFFSELWGDDCNEGYPGYQDIIILTDPTNDNGYYIIHKERIYYPSSEGGNKFRQLKYSYIDMTLNESKGDIIYKNIAFSPYRHLQVNHLNSIYHSNGQDWWIIQAMKETNSFMIYLLDEEGFHQQDYIDFGFEANDDWFSSGGTAKFSPDGTKYALYNYYHQLHVYDFDRETGVLSNHQQINVLPPYQEIIRRGSVEWSSNSRFIYTASRLELHQIDTWEVDIENEGIILIDTFNGTADPLPNQFHLMAQGPDCRIYITGGSNKTYHVINEPDEKGLSCNFDQNGIELPYHAGRSSMPNHPRWRVDEEEKCDPTISSVFGIPVFTRKNLTVYPNPTRDLVNIKIPENQIGILEIRNSNGQLILEEDVAVKTIETQINLFPYSSGIYYIEFVLESNKNKIIYSTKVELIK